MSKKHLVRAAPLVLIATFALSACKDDDTSTAPEPDIDKPVITNPGTDTPSEPKDNDSNDGTDPKTKPLSDVEKGKKLAAVCSGCHSLTDNTTRVGPSLRGIYNRDIASVSGYTYSSALQDLEGNWDEETLTRFIQNPQNVVKGSRMPAVGVSSEEDAKNIVAYLKTLSP
jgi:cytochrome c2